MLKALPSDINAEKELISMIFLKNDILAEILNKLKPTDFYSSVNQVIYAKLIEMYSKDIPIGITTFVNCLGKENLLSIGGVTNLTEIINASASYQQYKTYTNMLKELSNKRTVIKSCTSLLETIYDTEESTQEIISNLENEFIGMDTEEQEGTINAEQLMESTMNTIEEGLKNGGKIKGIPTGYSNLDNAINGMQKKDLIILAARPSMGKSALIVNIMNNIPKEFNSILFELEMSKEKIGVRALAAKALQNSQNLAKGKDIDNNMEVIMRKANDISVKNNMFLNCRAGQTLPQIRAEAKKIKIKNGLDVLIVDHIGLIVPNNPKASRNDQLGQISAGLKIIAKELDVCVIALSQLSRACETRSDKHPMLSDLRDSGNLEQDADIVLFLYRDDYYAERENRDSKKPGVLEIMAGKSRDGEVGLIELSYNTTYQKITETWKR